MSSTRVQVWDLPLRLFHWLLAIAVVVAFISAKIGGNAMLWHGRAGLAVIGLLSFRIIWGFVGSTHSRFTSFVRGPAAMRAYLAGQWHGLGHNPLGALSVLALLGLPAALAVTGLFASDDIAYEGYLYPLIDAALSSRLTGIHKLFEPFLIGLVALHIGAIAFYMRVKKTNLVKPMITGTVESPHTLPTDAKPMPASRIGLVIAIALALFATWAASGALLPPPPPPVTTPAW